MVSCIARFFRDCNISGGGGCIAPGGTGGYVLYRLGFRLSNDHDYYAMEDTEEWRRASILAYWLNALSFSCWCWVSGCVHTNKVESSPIQSSQTLESRGVQTDRVESNQVCESPNGFQYSLNSTQVKISTSMETMLVLHAIMWRRKWRRKRQNIWVHPINIKRPEYGIFSHLYPDLLEDKEKFRGFFHNVYRAILSSVTIGRTGNTKTKHQL